MLFGHEFQPKFKSGQAKIHLVRKKYNNSVDFQTASPKEKAEAEVGIEISEPSSPLKSQKSEGFMELIRIN